MIDLSYLKYTTNDDKTLIMQLVDIFIKQLPDLKKEIVTSYSEQNWISLRDAAHKAKNSFEMMGMKNPALELKQLEILSTKNHSNPEMQILVDNFVKNCDSVAREIQNLEI
jgi:HPt (histidine-containing phosphotransfer) domain-containing protein